MPTPAIKHDDTRDPKHPYDSLCGCKSCERAELRAYKRGYAQDPPRMAWRGPLVALTIMLITAVMVCSLLYLAFGDTKAHAREGAIHPVPIPAAHAKARAKCPIDKPLICRASLVHAYEAIQWQQEARRNDAKRVKGYGVQHALRLASALYNVPLSELRTVGTCESHLTPSSKNLHSSASGVFQFLDSTWARAGIPGFSVFDAYANAIAAARLVRSDGSWREWSCQP